MLYVDLFLSPIFELQLYLNLPKKMYKIKNFNLKKQIIPNNESIAVLILNRIQKLHLRY